MYNYDYFFKSVVLLHTWLACLDDNNFIDASSYKPERWLDELTKKSPFLVVPFGCGKRMCPGKRFVELELQIVLAKVYFSAQNVYISSTMTTVIKEGFKWVIFKE